MARARKRRISTRMMRFLTAFLKHPFVVKMLVVCGGFIVVVNLLVSQLGQSDGFLLSPYHLWDKSQALGLLVKHHLSPRPDTPIPTPKQALRRAVQRQRVPRYLVFAIAHTESNFMPYRISRTGAMGLMQLMPATARDMGVTDPFHAGQNANGGVKYLAWLWKRYRGDTRRVVAAYNAGPGCVPRTGPYRVPSETRAYANRVFRYANLLKR